MKIAFSTIACPSYGAAEWAQAVEAFGYDAIELYAMNGQRLTPELLTEHLEEVRSALSGIPIASINSWGRLSSADPDERAVQARQIGRALELAADLASPMVKTFGGELPEDVPAAEVYAYMSEELARLAGRARQLGVTLVLETHDAFCRGSQLHELLGRVDDPGFGALWDVYHPFRMGEAPAVTDGYIGDRVRHVHVKDAVLVDGAWQFVLLGDGTLPVDEMLDLLRRRGYDGYVSVDWELMWHPHIAGPEVTLPHFAAELRRYRR